VTRGCTFGGYLLREKGVALTHRVLCRHMCRDGDGGVLAGTVQVFQLPLCYSAALQQHGGRVGGRLCCRSTSDVSAVCSGTWVVL
jgi:hypothetical protein